MEYLSFPDQGYQMTLLHSSAELPELEFDLFLYLDPRHVALQHGPNWQIFTLLHEGRVVGLAHFFRETDKAVSPWRAPFGGIQVTDEVPKATLILFVRQIHEHLLEQGAKSIKWLQCPDVYAPKINLRLRQALAELNYTLLHEQRNHHVPVTSIPFDQIIHLSSKRRLQKCRNAGFTVQQETIDQLPEAYALLEQCRKEKQKPLSLSLEQLNQYFFLFPDQYQLFTVRRGEELAAVGVTVRINSQILNHLYPASPTTYNNFSPTILLTQGIYQYCQREGIAMLDLGVSAPAHEHEAAYQGLFTFKARLGGIESWKPTFLFTE